MTPKEHAYFRVLRVLELQPEIPQRELASKLGISMGKANYLREYRPDLVRVSSCL